MVRHADPSDLPELLEIYRELRTAKLPGMTWSEDYPSDRDIEDDVLNDALYVLEEEGRIAAAAAREPDEVGEMMEGCGEDQSCEISRVGVRRAMHGQGVGTRLMAELLPMLKQEGFDVVRLLVAPENIPALHLYMGAGFRILGSADKYDIHWLCCEKRL